MRRFAPDFRPEPLPTIEQLEEYRALMIDTTHLAGRGVRVFNDNPDTEFMLPGGVTEWSVPDRKMRTHIEHDRNYAASFKTLGETARRLLVLETESWLSADKTTYLTFRNMYRFSWQEGGPVSEARAQLWEINSRSTVDAELLPYFAKDILAMELDQTDEPLRTMEPRDIDEVALDCLLDRTDSFRRDLASVGDVAARIAS